MRPVYWCAAIAVVGLALVALLPLSPALAAGDQRQARFIGALLLAAVCASIALVKGGRPLLWTAFSIGAAAAGIGLLLAHLDANGRCLASYDGRPVLIGRDYTPSAADYVSKNPGLSAPDLLLDVGGVAERVWTAQSISSCRFWTGSGGVLALPLFAAAVCALVVRRGFRFASAAAPRAGAAVPAVAAPGGPARMAPAARYDAFLSYRHTGPDKSYAGDILEALESRGLRVAVDFRDFAPNQHFLAEMERCIKESRFVLCIVTAQYFDSDHTSEEAIISKTLDMADRRKRLVPLIFERVELPVWLHGLVGIDCTASASVDPVERLVGLLTTAQDAAPSQRS